MVDHNMTRTDVQSFADFMMQKYVKTKADPFDSLVKLGNLPPSNRAVVAPGDQWMSSRNPRDLHDLYILPEKWGKEMQSLWLRHRYMHLTAWEELGTENDNVENMFFNRGDLGACQECTFTIDTWTIGTFQRSSYNAYPSVLGTYRRALSFQKESYRLGAELNNNNGPYENDPSEQLKLAMKMLDDAHQLTCHRIMMNTALECMNIIEFESKWGGNDRRHLADRDRLWRQIHEDIMVGHLGRVIDGFNSTRDRSYFPRISRCCGPTALRSILLQADNQQIVDRGALDRAITSYAVAKLNPDGGPAITLSPTLGKFANGMIAGCFAPYLESPDGPEWSSPMRENVEAVFTIVGGLDQTDGTDIWVNNYDKHGEQMLWHSVPQETAMIAMRAIATTINADNSAAAQFFKRHVCAVRGPRRDDALTPEELLRTDIFLFLQLYLLNLCKDPMLNQRAEQFFQKMIVATDIDRIANEDGWISISEDERRDYNTFIGDRIRMDVDEFNNLMKVYGSFRGESGNGKGLEIHDTAKFAQYGLRIPVALRYTRIHILKFICMLLGAVGKDGAKPGFFLSNPPYYLKQTNAGTMMTIINHWLDVMCGVPKVPNLIVLPNAVLDSIKSAGLYFNNDILDFFKNATKNHSRRMAELRGHHEASVANGWIQLEMPWDFLEAPMKTTHGGYVKRSNEAGFNPGVDMYDEPTTIMGKMYYNLLNQHQLIRQLYSEPVTKYHEVMGGGEQHRPMWKDQKSVIVPVLSYREAHIEKKPDGTYVRSIEGASSLGRYPDFNLASGSTRIIRNTPTSGALPYRDIRR